MSGWRNIHRNFFLQSSKNDESEGLSDEDKISDDEGYPKPKEPLFDLGREEDNLFLNNSCQDIKSDTNEFESVNQDGASTWSSVFEETKELMRLQGNSSSSVSHSVIHEERTPWKGSRNKNKHKFSFGFHSEACLPLSEIDQNEKSTEVHQDFEGLEELEHGNEKHSMAELLEGLRKDNKKQSECPQVSFELSTGEHKVSEHPMSELLEGFLQNHSPHRETPIMNKETRGIRSARTDKRSRSCLAYGAHDKGDLSDPMECANSSDEETEKLQLQVYDKDQLKYTSLEITGKTMSDKFQDVLNAAPMHNQLMLLATSKQNGIGYFGRLQQVLQTEKEQHMEFLNQPKAGITDEVRAIDVKILSRYLDAKLTVCNCSLGENVKSTQCAQSPQMLKVIEEKRTVIFSSRVCNSVELEVGNFIRIHPPWKQLFENTLRRLPLPTFAVRCTVYTCLTCGGFVPAFRINHTMSDAPGTGTLLLGESARGMHLPSANPDAPGTGALLLGESARGMHLPSANPVWNRELMVVCDPPQVTYMHHGYVVAQDPNIVPMGVDDMVSRCLGGSSFVQ